MYSGIWIIIIKCLLIIFVHNVNAAKILGLFNSPSYSHVIVHDSLMQELARRGHEVTVVSSFPPKNAQLPETYRFVHVSNDDESYKQTMQRWMKNAEEGTVSLYDMMKFLIATTDQFEAALYHPNFVNLKNESFDLLVLGWFMNEFQLGVASHFKCPSVVISSPRSTTMSRSLVGNPSSASYTPHLLLNLYGPMTFMQRMKNFMFALIDYCMHCATEYFVQRKKFEKNFPPEQFGSYEDARKNVSLVLVNQHFSEGTIETSLPAMVEIGGMHIKPGAQLPKNIEEFIGGAKDGVIFFSLGSNVRSSHLSVERRNIFLRVFSKLKQRVLWKWEDDQLPSKPDNVMISKWFPQSDILAHPNVKLFISHCGLGSLFESKYHGVPILGIPVFADQPSNAKHLERDGWGLSIPLVDVNEQLLTNALNEMLTNDTYTKKAKILSQIYKDRPMTPLDTAAYWVEYVLRYNGAKHMQSPAVHLNFFQYYLLDVFAVILISAYIIFKIFKLIFVFLFRKCKKCMSKEKTKKD